MKWRQYAKPLLQQYVGAITIGFIIATGVSVLISTLVQASAAYWMMLEEAKTNYRVTPNFPWNNLIIAVVSATLYLLIAYGLARWLYFPRRGNSSEISGPNSPVETSEL